MTSYEEWRVTGEPGGGFQPYTFTWSPARGEPDPESAARGFVELVEEHETWADGPYLHRRTVTVTEWEPVEEGQVSAFLATQAAEQGSVRGTGTPDDPEGTQRREDT